MRAERHDVDIGVRPAGSDSSGDGVGDVGVAASLGEAGATIVALNAALLYPLYRKRIFLRI